MTDLSDLKAGDKVIQTCWSWYGSGEFVRTIKNITPSGLIRVGTILYYKNGQCRGQHDSSIRRWTQWEEDKIKRIELERKTRTACANVFDKCRNKLTYEQATSILEILKGE